MAVETGEFIQAVKRMIRAAGRRCADSDEWELAELASMQDDLDTALRTAVDGLRERGMSWAYIASGLGTTRQAAQMRFGKPRA